MKLSQVSVFLENKSGRLAAVSRLLGEQGVNMRAISIADTSDFGILRLIVDKPELAYRLLQEHRFSASISEAIGVEVGDTPGSLARILDLLEKYKINIEYLYASSGIDSDKALIIFKVEDIEQAIEVLQANGIALVSSEKF